MLCLNTGTSVPLVRGKVKKGLILLELEGSTVKKGLPPLTKKL